MGKQELNNLVRIGNLKAEPASKKEFDGMIASARRSLTDAQNESIETDSQFTWPMAQRTALPSRPFAIGVIDPRIGLPCFRHSFTPSARQTRTSKSS
jgi:hypothetical protein